jgi:uncharacterized delta-60 repeat protein
MNSKRPFTTGSLLASILASVSLTLSAQVLLDPAFGVGGILITAHDSVADHVRRVRIQPDGRFLVLATDSAYESGGPAEASLHRYYPDGTTDDTFAGGTPFRILGLRDFDLLPDGRMVTVITRYSFGITPTDVCRFSADGLPDESFGTKGCVTIGSNGQYEGRRIRRRTDGKIVVIGATTGGLSFLARLLPDGAFDGTFGRDGVAYGPGTSSDYSLDGPWVFDYTGDFAIQDDGKIVYGVGEECVSYSIYRMNANGVLDTSFGQSGSVTIDIPVPIYYCDTFAFSLVKRRDSRLVVTGAGVSWFGDFSVASIALLNTDGTFVSTFGSSGKVAISTQDTRGPASAAIVLPNNQILLGGMKENAFALTRLNANGAVDTSFGTNGTLRTPFGTSTTTSILSMTMSSDEKLLVAGSVKDQGGQSKIGLAKYLQVTTRKRPGR